MRKNYHIGDTITLQVRESEDDSCRGCFFFRGDNLGQGCFHNSGVPCIDNIVESEYDKLESSSHHPIFIESRTRKKRRKIITNN